MSQNSGASLSVSGTSFKSGSGSSADSFAGALDAVSSNGDMSNLSLPTVPSRGRAESFVSLAPSIASTELLKVGTSRTNTSTPASSGYHNRSKSADIPTTDSFQLSSSVGNASNLGSITEMKNDPSEVRVDGAKLSVGSLGSRKGDQDNSLGDENLLPSNRSSINTDTSFESSSTSPPSGGGNAHGSSNPDSGGGGSGSVTNDTPMSKKSRRRTPPEGPNALTSSVKSTGGASHNRKSSNILSNMFSTSYNKVLEDFRKLFPPNHYNGNQGLLLTHFSCALQTDPGLLEQGRLFVTSQGIYFTSFLRLKLRIFINFSEVEFFKKHQVMVVFPTAILICKKDGTNTVFASFPSRDKSLALINHYFQCFQKDPMFFHNNRELFFKELTRNYGAKFVPPADSEEEITEESENSSDKDGGSESNKDEKPTTDGGSKLQIPSSRYAMDDGGKSTNSSTNENAVEHEVIKVPRDKKRETSQDRNSRTLTRDKDDSLMKDPAISVPGFYDNDADSGNDDEDEENETHITSSEPEVDCTCEVHGTKSGWTKYLDNIYYISVDSAFNMLFEKSDFYHDVLKRRAATNFVCGKWRKTPGKAGQRERQLTYIMPTNSSVPVAPKAVDVTEMQYVDANECESKKIYTAKTRIKNHGKFSDSFVIHIKYCLTKSSRQRFRFQMSTKLEFVSSWVLMKDLIREQVDEGLKSHCDALDKALQLKISESKMGARPPLANIYINGPSSGSVSGAATVAGGVATGGAKDYPPDQYRTGDSDGPGFEERRDHRSGTIYQEPILTTQQSRPGTIASSLKAYSRQGSLELLAPSSPISPPMFESMTYQLQNWTLLKLLAILLFFLACVSHSLLIYQLSSISPLLSTIAHHPHVITPSVTATPPTLDPSSAATPPPPNNIQAPISSSPSRVSSLHGLPLKQPVDSPPFEDFLSAENSRTIQPDQFPWAAGSESGDTAREDKNVNSNQLFKMLLTSHLQQQNQFKLILKNSMNLLEVMTSNVNNMQVLVSSQITQHEAIMKEFLDSSKTSRDESSCNQSPNSETWCQPHDLKEQKVNPGKPEDAEKSQKLPDVGKKPSEERAKLKS